MDNRELEKETEITEAEVELGASQDTVDEDVAVTEQIEEVTDEPKKSKKEKKAKEKKAKESSGKGSKKAILICLIAAAIVVVLGIGAAGILWYIGSEADDERLPGETEDMPELEDGTKFH
ncbi:MAG: hypothetical protein IKB51_00780 [Clostridia bacterium]|nr:hypothetical protein [Clostridia bacterium]